MARRELTVKQRKFVKEYAASGNGTRAALAAYDTTDPHTAEVIASENLRKPGVQAAVDELLDAQGLSDAELLAVHARFLALHRSEDPQEKALALKALDMAYRLKGAYPRGADIEARRRVPIPEGPSAPVGAARVVSLLDESRRVVLRETVLRETEMVERCSEARVAESRTSAAGE